MKFRNLVEINANWLEDTRLIIICDRLVYVFHKDVVVLD